MLKALFLALNVRPSEEKQVLLLLGKGFFLGVFLATYEVSAETLFLNRLSEYLKEAILLSGVLGVITTALFAFVQSRVNFGKLVLGNLFLIFLFTIVIFYALRGTAEGIQDIVIFVMFAMIGPFMAVLLLGFWGTFGRMFDLRQSKRIIGGIDIGQLLAAIITLFSVPFLASIIPDTTNYLSICAVSLLFSLVFMWFIQRNYRLQDAEVSELQSDDEDTMDTSISSLIKDNYVKLLSTFLFFSMIAFTFVQYSFQEVVSQQYPEEQALRNFIALFKGSILVLGLLMQTFVNDKIIGEYGLKIALMIAPIILAAFTIGAIVAGHMFGFEANSAVNFIYFFLFISLSRLFNFTLRDSLENPTFKLYFMPLDAKVRFNIQTKVEGVVNEASRLVAGALIIILAYLAFDLIHYSYALLFILAGYFLVIGKMYEEYRNRIRSKLERQQRAILNTALAPAQLLVETLSRQLKNIDINKVVFSFKLLEKVQPALLPNSINTLMGHDSPEIKDFAQMKMNELKGLSVSDRYVISMDKSEGEEKAKNVVSGFDVLNMFKSGEVSKNRLYKLCKSEKWEDRQYAAELISNATGKENISFLVELLHDSESKVRKTAIKTAQQKHTEEVINALIFNLSDSRFSLEAGNVLTIIGEKALDVLDAAFFRSGQTTNSMLKIVHTIGRIGGDKARDLLWNKIDYPDKVIVSQVLLALADTGFKAGISQISRIKYAIESDIEAIAWNLAALYEVEHFSFSQEIKKALNEENDNDVDHIYMLLSMLYDAHSIQLVKENIESGTSEGITYAVELLDVFLSEDLKQKVIPVMDDISPAEKVKKLETFYPRERIDDSLVLKFILNRDFTQTNRFTKACILYQIGVDKMNHFEMDVIANLFNPDRLIREMAAWALYRIDESSYHENIKRLNYIDRQKIDAIIRSDENDSLNSKMFDKVQFLRKLDAFKEIRGLTLADVVDIVDVIEIKQDQLLSINAEMQDNFFLVYDGSVEVYQNGTVIEQSSKGEFIGELMISKKSLNSNNVKAINDTVLFKIPKDPFYELLSDNVELAQKIVEVV